MPTIHRLQWIDAQIRAGQYPNARSLSDAFEISRRQALRDIEYLRDSLGAPLEYSALHRGYTYTSDRFTLPGPFVTPSQRTALGSLAAYYQEAAERDARSAPVYADLADLFRRLHGGGSAPRAAARPQPPGNLAPYRARLSVKPGRPPAPALQPYWRGSPHPGESVYEFADPGAFLTALLSTGQPYRIDSPRWLRAWLMARLHLLYSANADVTHHVTPAQVPLPHSDTRRAPAMNQVRNETGARWHPTWMSYTGAVAGILEAAGMGRWEYWKLMGASGMAYHLVMHERCCISSVTMYDWTSTHRMALDRIGILSESFETAPGTATFAAARRRAITNIKAAIDRGAGVVLWGVDTGEFGVVYGYDDEDGVLLASGCMASAGGASNPILYENLGRTFPDAPILYYQVILEQVPTDEAQVALSSLQSYVDQMQRGFHVGRGYHAGLLAYDSWIRGLQSADFDQRGVRYAASVYAEAKGCAAKYLEQLASSDGALAPTAAAFRRTAELFERIQSALGQDGNGPGALHLPVTAAQAEGLIPLLRQAKASDAESVALVQAYLSAK